MLLGRFLSGFLKTQIVGIGVFNKSAAGRLFQRTGAAIEKVLFLKTPYLGGGAAGLILIGGSECLINKGNLLSILLPGYLIYLFKIFLFQLSTQRLPSRKQTIFKMSFRGKPQHCELNL